MGNNGAAQGVKGVSAQASHRLQKCIHESLLQVQAKTYLDGSTDTEFGLRGKWYGPHWEIVYHPWADFTEIKEVEAYEWPDPEDPSRMKGVADWARYQHEKTDYAVVGMVGGPWGAFEICAHYMRGFGKFLLTWWRIRDSQRR